MIRILRWTETYETRDSLRIRGPLSWVRLPVRQGRGYCTLAARHGAKGLGVWLALLELAAAQPKGKRGRFDDGPVTIALLARIEPDDVLEVLPTLVELEWIEADLPAPRIRLAEACRINAADQPQIPGLEDRTGQDRTGEQKASLSPISQDPRPAPEGPRSEAIPADPEEAALLHAIRTSSTAFIRDDPRITPKWLTAQRRAYPRGAVPAEVAKADAWSQANPAKSKGRKSASRFLAYWFARAQESAARGGRFNSRAPAHASDEELRRIAQSLDTAAGRMPQ